MTFDGNLDFWMIFGILEVWMESWKSSNLGFV